MKTIIAAGVLFLFFSCNQQKNHRQIISELQKDEAKQIVSHMFQFKITNDRSLILAPFSTDPEAIVIIASSVYSYKNFGPPARKILGRVEKQTFEVQTEKYVHFGSGCFVYTWKGINKLYSKSGTETTIDPFVGSYTFQKQADGWRMVLLHESWNKITIDSGMPKK